MSINVNYAQMKFDFYCLSSDLKPDKANIGSDLLETDTLLRYKWTGQQWILIPYASSSTEYGLTQAGDIFTYSKTFLSVASNDFAQVRLTTGSKYLHFTIQYTSEDKARFATYLNSTYSANGTTVTPFNRKTNSTEILLSTIRITPTVNVLGIQRGDDFIGATGGTSRAGGVSSPIIESILAPNQDFLIRFTNAGNSTKDLNIIINMYEL